MLICDKCGSSNLVARTTLTRADPDMTTSLPVDLCIKCHDSYAQTFAGLYAFQKSYTAPNDKAAVSPGEVTP